MTEHRDPSNGWLIFFFVCFAIVLIGIAVFFARDINKEPAPDAAKGSMILPHDLLHIYHSHIV